MPIWLATALTKLGMLTVSPWAFVLVLLYGVTWFAFDRESLNWHGVATLATLLMTLVVQRSEHRDTQAIHAKLDSLLKADENADQSLVDIDEEEPEVVEQHRERKNKSDQARTSPEESPR